VELAGDHTPVYRCAAEAKPVKLDRGYHAVLPGSEPRQRRAAGWAAFVSVFGTSAYTVRSEDPPILWSA
jgi:hypothetical protein